MANYQRKNPDGFWDTPNSSGVYTYGSVKWYFPLRISYRWVSTLRHFSNSVGRQELMKTRDKVRNWAYDNALTLIFLSIMFFITNIVTISRIGW